MSKQKNLLQFLLIRPRLKNAKAFIEYANMSNKIFDKLIQSVNKPMKVK